MPEDIRIRESTTIELSGFRVGASNIWDRELPDAQGVVALRPSANLSFLDLATRDERREKVAAGSVIALGPDRYRVERVEAPGEERGAVILTKVAP